MKYKDFLAKKQIVVEACGFDVPLDKLNPMLFDWQKVIVRWALHRGRAALFEDCGLGKTPQQLEWAKQVCSLEHGNVLILTPLAVAAQTKREGEKFGIPVTICKHGDDVRPGVNVANYERLHHFKPGQFGGIVLDESSILKSFDGMTRKLIQEFTAGIKYRLACTATPAPNDLIELTNHAEFLDVMSGKEIIALFFKQDGNTTHQWRLKGHAREAFWKWMSEWSVAIRKPADLGYDDGAFKLPPLKIHHVTVNGNALDGMLFPVEARTLLERRQARRDSMHDRVSVTAGLVNGNSDTWLVWCDLNCESEALTKAIPGAVEVKGSDSAEYKEQSLADFSLGKIRVMVTKPSIAGWGMNWQHCHNVAFVGLSDSYEQFYQAVRRCWRFGQSKAVDCYVIAADTEGAVVANIERKERQATEMFENIVRHMSVHELNKRQERDVMTYKTDDANGDGWKIMLGDSCERIKEIAPDSIGLSVFSPPFPGMYAYTNSPRDVGNVKNWTSLVEHFKFIAADMLRATMPGRCCCVHLTQEPVFKGREGHVGLRDFRGTVINMMQDCGWFYYSEVTIDKNPMLKASRTKEGTLLFKTLAKDSAGCRPALADYLLVFKKDGENPIPIRSGISAKYGNKEGWLSQEEWCEWASPVWYRAMPKAKSEHQPFQGNYPSRHQDTDGILEGDVLRNFRDAKDDQDEKHLCPLQLGVIERCIKLWSAPGDTVFSPFAGIGSEGYQAVKLKRRFVGIELKESYWKVACENIRQAETEVRNESRDLLTAAV